MAETYALVGIGAGSAGLTAAGFAVQLEVRVYPTYSTANMQAAAEIRVAQLLGGTSGRIIRGVAHLLR